VATIASKASHLQSPLPNPVYPTRRLHPYVVQLEARDLATHLNKVQTITRSEAHHC
jgi:hypothetical protein